MNFPAFGEVGQRDLNALGLRGLARLLGAVCCWNQAHWSIVIDSQDT